MKAVSVVVVVCGLSSVVAAPVARVGILSLGRQGLANAGIGIGSMATNMATGLASNALGALSGIPILGTFAQIGKAAVNTGNSFAQMGMGIGQTAANRFGGLGATVQQQLAAQQQLALQQQLASQQQQLLASQQQLAAQQQFSGRQQPTDEFLAQPQRPISQVQAQQQFASQASQQRMPQPLQQSTQQEESAQQQANDLRETDNFQDILGPIQWDSWWKPAPPQPIYIGS